MGVGALIRFFNHDRRIGGGAPTDMFGALGDSILSGKNNTANLTKFGLDPTVR